MNSIVGAITQAQAPVEVPEPSVEELTRTLAGVEVRQWITAAAIFLLSIVAASLVRRSTSNLVTRSQAGHGVLLAGRLASYLIVALGVVYAMDAIGVAVTPLLGALGLVGVALAFAMQDVLENFVAGILLQFRRPFRRGDEVESDDFEGVVRGIDSRTVTMVTPDGETVRLPSADVIKSPIVNHTSVGRRRSTLDVSVGYDSNLDEVVEILAEAVQVEGVLDTPPPQAYVHTFSDSGVDISIHFWHLPSIADKWRVTDEAARSVHRTLRERNIEIPFPQRVIRFASDEERTSSPRPSDVS